MGDVWLTQGVPVHEPCRALFDELRLARSLVDAVVAADATFAAGVTTQAAVADHIAEHPRWNGVPRAREALRLSVDRSASPPETRLRMVWVLTLGLPAPLVNVPVFARTSGRLLGFPDLLDVDAGLAVEYDGAHHRPVGRQTSDNRREDSLRDGARGVRAAESVSSAP